MGAAQWNPEVQHFCSGVPKLLVGLKLDLRNDPNTLKELAKVGQKPVSTEQVRGEFSARKIRAEGEVGNKERHGARQDRA